jgi:hypothetical protein
MSGPAISCTQVTPRLAAWHSAASWAASSASSGSIASACRLARWFASPRTTPVGVPSAARSQPSASSAPEAPSTSTVARPWWPSTLDRYAGRPAAAASAAASGSSGAGKRVSS